MSQGVEFVHSPPALQHMQNCTAYFVAPAQGHLDMRFWSFIGDCPSAYFAFTHILSVFPPRAI
jgi:hypothetical protein